MCNTQVWVFPYVNILYFHSTNFSHGCSINHPPTILQASTLHPVQSSDHGVSAIRDDPCSWSLVAFRPCFVRCHHHRRVRLSAQSHYEAHAMCVFRYFTEHSRSAVPDQFDPSVHALAYACLCFVPFLDLFLFPYSPCRYGYR